MCEGVDLEPHDLSRLEREVDAVRLLLGAKKIMSVDELRRQIEAIPEDDYHRMTYYERWTRSMLANLLEKGIVTEAELRAAMTELGA
jgi:hypothetical protein